MNALSLTLADVDVHINAVPILQGISLSVQSGEFITIFGPNGAGKSTLLNAMTGIQEIASGTLRIDTPNGKKPRIGMVFQNYNESMLPWHSVYANLEIVLQARAAADEQQFKNPSHRARTIHDILEQAGISHLALREFSSLSGGQKQLTAICRALIVEPDILLLDEPFSALDYITARGVEDTLLRLWDAHNRTHAMIGLCVSHNPDSALLLADRILLLSRTPATILQRIDITLERPRSASMLTSEDFLTLRSTLLSHLEYAYAME
jgi:NitT/TauT family transport system ATP-binding protein